MADENTGGTPPETTGDGNPPVDETTKETTTPPGDQNDDTLTLPPPPQGPTSETLAKETPEEKEKRERVARINLIKRIGQGLTEAGLDDEVVLLGLARREGMSVERRGRIEAFAAQLKETP